MHLIEIVEAYIALLELMRKESDYQTAHAMVTLKRALKPQADFFTAEETKLMEQYAKKDEKGRVITTEQGRFLFAHPDQAPEYARRRTELAMVEVTDPFPQIVIPPPARITPQQLEALEGFIRFEEVQA